MNYPQATLNDYLHALTAKDLDNELWHFALNFYAKKGVSQRLLLLQDNHQLNVNYLLFIYWLKDQQLIIHNEFFEPLLAIILCMDEQYLEPIRRLRKNVKTWPVSPAPYQHCKSLELQLEQHQIALIYRYFNQHRSSLDHKATITNNEAFFFWLDQEKAKNIFLLLNEISDLSGMPNAQE